jgi:hypothetical protein
VVLRQVGDRLRLSWKAPARNQDGTSENVDLEEARILRRVIDIPAPPVTIEDAPGENAAPGEPPAPSETAPPSQTQSPGEPLAPSETPAASETPPASETAPSAGQAAAPLEPAEGLAAPPAPPPPPPFQSEAVGVAQVDSAILGEPKFHEEPVDPSWIGKRVEYALVYVNRKGRESAPSEVVRIDPAPALAPPEALKAEAGDGFVALSWSPPPEAPASLAFTVHRRLQETPRYPEAPLTPEPLSAASFEDRTAVFGATSCYVVAAVPESSGSISSLPSEEVCLTPEDRFPPPAPSGLVAVPSSGAILLSWREVDAPDRKGYRVYRGASADGPFELLAEVADSSYTDGTAASGGTYYYAVTAIDDAPGVNESPRSEAAEARRSP